MKTEARWGTVALAAAFCLAVSASSAAILTTNGEPDPTWNSNAMLLWLRADVGFTPSVWTDQSTYGNSAAQATAAYQPVYSATGLNGQPAILFDGADKHMIIATPPTGEQTAFIVYKEVPSATAAIKSLQSYPFFNKPMVHLYLQI